MTDKVRSEAKFVEEYIKQGDATGWFEQLYTMADDDASRIPWAKLQTQPLLLEWLAEQQLSGAGRRALVIGSGLGDDAEGLARHGFSVTAFDISATAVAWCQKRFPESLVDYQVADMFAPPDEWLQAFDLVLEVNIVQALPLSWRKRAIAAEAQFVAPNGHLIVLSMGRDDEITEPVGPPWVMARYELRHFEEVGLQEVSFEVFNDEPVRRLRVVYQRAA
jgi:SAM-dependent methyltransferase